MNRPGHQRARGRGFSLVEIALVLVIVGILASAAIVPLASHDASRRERAMQDELSRIRDALVAHLISHDRLPCPMSAAEPRDAASAAGRCTTFRGGVPATSLALSGPLDARGALLDPWGRPYRYSLSDADDERRGTPGAPDWSVAGESAAVGIDGLRGSLTLCERAVASCPDAALRATDLVFVVLSHGADAGDAGDQRQNLAARGSFTLAARSEVPSKRFDDALVWASRSELVWWLLRAARLP